MRKPSKNSESNKHPAGRKFCRLNFFIKIYRNLLTVQIIYAIIIKSLIRSISAIKYGRFPEWPKGTDCKSVVYDFGGSNPPPSTKIDSIRQDAVFCFEGGGFESRLLETARWAVSTGVALPQQRESTPSEGVRPFCALRGHNPSIPGNRDTLAFCAKAAVSACRSRSPSEKDYIRLFATTRRPGAYLSHFPLTRRVKKQTARHIQSPTIAIQIPIAPIPKCTAST